MENHSIKNEEQIKKAWIKPELEILDVSRDTKGSGVWEYIYDPNTGFYKNQWVMCS
ncbi:hypothetical protein HPT25_05410 [Bacillus sp. BRMEA1]|uniref:hypothetical protein n=1 Tax=Neobacillus endophyticus TaxID=2738405 RepID=UPI001564E7E7|nr:hypothetical protein [Neobacillus endophyticus]NRD76931.1 hypothetical protein [Neobacillus endophyticus]